MQRQVGQQGGCAGIVSAGGPAGVPLIAGVDWLARLAISTACKFQAVASDSQHGCARGQQPGRTGWFLLPLPIAISLGLRIDNFGLNLNRTN